MTLSQRMPKWRMTASPGVSLAVAAAGEVTVPAPAGLQTIVLPSALDRWMGSSFRDYTPERIESILRGALSSGDLRMQWELFDLMEGSWPTLMKALNDLKDSVVSMDWGLQAWTEGDEKPAETAEARKAFCESALWKMRPNPAKDENAFEATIKDILDAWGKGVSVLEIEWMGTPKGLLPRCTRYVYPRYYGYPLSGDELMLNVTEIQSGRTRSDYSYAAHAAPLTEDQWLPFPPNKFLICVAKQKSGHPISGAMLRALAWWWCAANFSSAWFLNFAQIFGLPIRWATYDVNQPGLLDQICDMLENMGSNAWAAFPAGTTLELKEPAKSGTDNPQASIIDRAEKQCVMLILGQTLTSDVSKDGGSRALGDVHNSVRSDRITAASRFAADVVNYQLLPAICRLNYGNDEECPYVMPSAHEVKDAKALAERDAVLLPHMKMPRNYLYERHEIPIPDEDEETVGGHGSAPQPFGAGPAAALPPHRNLPAEDPASNRPVQAKDAGPTPELVRRAVADAAGAREKWLGPLSEEIDRLTRLAKSGQVSNAELAKFFERAAQSLPDLFQPEERDGFIASLEQALADAALEGATAAINKPSA